MEKLYKVQVSGMIEVAGHITVKAENPHDAEIIARNSVADGVNWESVGKSIDNLNNPAYDAFVAKLSIDSIKEVPK